MFFIFVDRPDVTMEHWMRDGALREWPVSQQDNTKVYSCTTRVDADRTLEYVARRHPGSKVQLAELRAVGQIALPTTPVSVSEINEKGMLPL